MGDHFGGILECLGVENNELQPAAHHTHSYIQPPINYTFNNLNRGASSWNAFAPSAAFHSFDDARAWRHDPPLHLNPHVHGPTYNSWIDSEEALDKLGTLSNRNGLGREERPVMHMKGNGSAIDTKKAGGGVHGGGAGNLRRAASTEERRLGPYTASQKILLVGEGDFSFSASLAMAFGSATNMVATSFDSWGFLSRNYKEVQSNILELAGKGCTVIHCVNATTMANHYLLGCKKFDRIIFNFPHAGFLGREEPRQSELCRQQKLVSLFLANAKKMIKEDGEIHITHKSNGFFREWNIPQLGLNEGLWLLEEVPFNFRDYPGYHTKYGFGGDKNFKSNPSKTYKFMNVPRPFIHFQHHHDMNFTSSSLRRDFYMRLDATQPTSDGVIYTRREQEEPRVLGFLSNLWAHDSVQLALLLCWVILCATVFIL